MTKEMKNAAENKPGFQTSKALADDQLAQVAAGGEFEKGDSNRVFSGDTPLYKIGDITHIIYNRGFFKTSAICLCRVIAVSSEKSGTLWTEFTYSVEIVSAPSNALADDPTLIGQKVHDVFESALIREIAD